MTALLRAWAKGNTLAADALMPLVYGELRRRAAAYLRRERKDHTLQPTALVNEVYLRLVNQRRADWRNRAQFFAVAAQIMRRILVDHARGGKMAKRSGQWVKVALDEQVKGRDAPDIDVLALDEALTMNRTVLGRSRSGSSRSPTLARRNGRSRVPGARSPCGRAMAASCFSSIRTARSWACVSTRAGGTWNTGIPVKLVEGPYAISSVAGARTYDVSPDGQRFLVIKPAKQGATPQIIVWQSWVDEELKRLVPAN